MKHRSPLRKSLAALGVVVLGSGVCGTRPAFAAPDAAAVPDGNLKFSIEMFNVLAKKGGNLAFSPSSVESAFAIALSGAKGGTAEEIEKVFHLSPGGEDRFVLELQEQISRIGKSGKVEIATANGLWVTTALTIVKDFIALAKEKFQAEVRPADFASSAEKVRVEINNWVLQKTHDKIRDLIAPNGLSPATSVVIVNAFYFKGDWLRQFKKESTSPDDFFSNGPGHLEVPFMHQLDSFAYGESGDTQFLELPYIGNEVSMIVLLPKAKDGLKKLESSLSAATFAEWCRKMAVERVSIALPKFKMTTGLNLSDTLQALGIKKAFVFKQADFSGIEATKLLFISNVIHQAFIQTDEKGTEAAAATAITMEAGAMAPREQPKIFKADHPFLYLLRERKTGAVLMMGRVADPS